MSFPKIVNLPKEGLDTGLCILSVFQSLTIFTSVRLLRFSIVLPNTKLFISFLKSVSQSFFACLRNCVHRYVWLYPGLLIKLYHSVHFFQPHSLTEIAGSCNGPHTFLCPPASAPAFLCSAWSSLGLPQAAAGIPTSAQVLSPSFLAGSCCAHHVALCYHFIFTICSSVGITRFQ